jgi:hypothetical protein
MNKNKFSTGVCTKKKKKKSTSKSRFSHGTKQYTHDYGYRSTKKKKKTYVELLQSQNSTANWLRERCKLSGSSIFVGLFNRIHNRFLLVREAQVLKSDSSLLGVRVFRHSGGDEQRTESKAKRAGKKKGTPCKG